MELNIEMKQQLEKLLAKPTLVTQAHIPFLQQLIEAFPYYQPLHLLLAKASNHTENQSLAFTKAALYTSGNVLYRFIHEPQQMVAVEDANIITYQPWVKFPEDEKNEVGEVEVVKPNETDIKAVADAPEIENLAPLPNEVLAVEEQQDHAKEQVEVIATPKVEKTPDTNFVLPEIENLAPLQNEVIKVCEPEQLVQKTVAEEEQKEADEQETFEEINELVVPAEDITVSQAPTSEEETAEVEETEADEEIALDETNVADEAVEVAQDLEIETLAAVDFFAFDPNFSSETVGEETVDAETSEVMAEPVATAAHENVVSKYDDDKLPFTFLWWLAKTRKDHEQIFRPFASPAKVSTQPQELQQQYVENIFHIQAPLELGEETQNFSSQNTKGSEIIDKFIKNDPQIKALKPDQINNENKAKRSAEDSNDLVSETLAQIYIEQMLYHKAIDTYQKLSLKFPEKSGYFADLIQSLEKKI